MNSLHIILKISQIALLSHQLIWQDTAFIPCNQTSQTIVENLSCFWSIPEQLNNSFSLVSVRRDCSFEILIFLSVIENGRCGRSTYLVLKHEKMKDKIHFFLLKIIIQVQKYLKFNLYHVCMGMGVDWFPLVYLIRSLFSLQNESKWLRYKCQFQKRFQKPKWFMVYLYHLQIRYCVYNGVYKCDYITFSRELFL